MTATWTIVGCGYTGARLARRLAREGVQVQCTRRGPEGCAALSAALGEGFAIHPYLLGQELGEAAGSQVVVISAPPGEGSPAAEASLARSLPATTRLLYLSTTGVYPASAGARVDDDTPSDPASRRGAMRLAVERALLEAHPNTIALRVPAIYGPHRGVHWRMREGEYRLIGDASTLVSRVHVDDLVEAVYFLGTQEAAEPGSYLVGDESPCSGREHALGIAARLGLTPPPQVDPASVSEEVRAMLGADRRIVPSRLRALGWRPRYADWREGLEQALEEEGR